MLVSGAPFRWKKDGLWQDSITGNGFRSVRMGFGNLSTGDLGWVDYSIEMDVEFQEFTQWGNMRVMVRQNGLFDCYAVNIDQNGLYLWRYDGRWDTGVQFGSYSTRVIPGEKNHLQVTVKDNQIKVVWNGKSVINAVDKMDKYPFGGVVVRSEMALTEITNVNIEMDKSIDSTEATHIMWERTQKLFPLPTNPKPFKTPEEAGFDNLMLIYTGYYSNGGGEWSYFDALPYVGYLNREYAIVDSLFDAFLFLGIGSPNDRYFDAIRGGKTESAGNLEDWVWYIDKLFDDQKQLAAFNRAKNKVNETLNEDTKAKVVIMIPNPLPAQKDFGMIDGEQLSFSSEGQGALVAQQKRMKAIDWYVREIEKRWQAAEFDSLELLGFYWMSEDMGNTLEQDIVDKTADYLHQKGYKFYWIPYNKAPGYDGEYKFDAVFLQPNYMFNEQVALTRFWHTYVDALTYGTNFEIEGENTVLTDPNARERYLTYLKAGVTLGYMDSARAYYFGGKALSTCALSDQDELREIYDKTYLFINREFTEGLFD